MSRIRTPPSLKWLINKRARLAGEIKWLEKNYSNQLEESKTKFAEAEINFQHAKEQLVNLECVVPEHLGTLKKNIAAIDAALSMHHIQIAPEIIPTIRPHSPDRATAYGEMTRYIYECLKFSGNSPVSTTELALYVANHCALNLSDKEFTKFKSKISHRIRNLHSDGKLTRVNQGSGSEGKWLLLQEPNQATIQSISSGRLNPCQ